MVSADANGAVLRVDGVERHYNLSREYSGAYAAPSKTQLSVAKGTGGYYWIAGAINGQPIQFRRHRRHLGGDQRAPARRLGIDYRVNGRAMVVSTASGTAKAWRVHLNSVKVGAIEVLGVEAVVVEGGSPTDALLGMSFSVASAGARSRACWCWSRRRPERRPGCRSGRQYRRARRRNSRA